MKARFHDYKGFDGNESMMAGFHDSMIGRIAMAIEGKENRTNGPND